MYKNVHATKLFFAVCVGITMPLYAMGEQPTLSFAEWLQKCTQLPIQPFNTQLPDQPPTALTQEEFRATLNIGVRKLLAALIKNKQLWLENKQPTETIRSSSSSGFFPFVQKLTLPEKARVITFGDLHGDIHSLLRMLQHLQEDDVLSAEDGFSLTSSDDPDDPGTYLLFLGDYVDRGWYGSEVLYTILRLKLANPYKVFMIRGNHEEPGINAQYGFELEYEKKFGTWLVDQPYFHGLYNGLPLAIYLHSEGNNDFIQCCHGGIEAGYDPAKLLTTPAQPLHSSTPTKVKYEHVPELNRITGHGVIIDCLDQYHPLQREPFEWLTYEHDLNTQEATTPFNGFMWSDCIFGPEGEKNPARYTPGRGFAFGRYATWAYLHTNSSDVARLVGIIRAHQHTPETMPDLITHDGIYQLWQPTEHDNNRLTGLVTTYITAPHSLYGTCYNYDFYTAGRLTLNPGGPANWALEKIKVSSPGAPEAS